MIYSLLSFKHALFTIAIVCGPMLNDNDHYGRQDFVNSNCTKQSKEQLKGSMSEICQNWLRCKNNDLNENHFVLTSSVLHGPAYGRIAQRSSSSSGSASSI